MAVAELLGLIIAAPGAAVACRDVWVHRALIGRAARQRVDARANRAAARPTTTELAITVRFRVRRTRRT